MRGEKEQACLDSIKEALFTYHGHLLIHPFTGKTHEEITNEEFLQEELWYVNNESSKHYFGLLEEDRQEFAFILRIAKANEKKSEFPDFIFENGFIEHFQITSSKTTRKGSEHIRTLHNFDLTVAQEAEQIKQEWNESPNFEKIRSRQWVLDNPDHNYYYLTQSFKKNWEHHIQSLKKYSGNKEIGIFLIEYTDVALSMVENVYKDWIDGMSQGDMREEEKFHCYRLSRDKEILKYVYDYRDWLKYVIFVYCDGFEVIRLDNIPYLLKLLPWEYIVYPMTVRTVSSLYSQSIKMPPTPEENIKES